MKRKILMFLIIFVFLGQSINLQTSQASQGYVDVYPSFSQGEKDQVSLAMLWLHDLYGNFHYKNNYSENSLIFKAMEQANGNYLNKNFDYSWDHNLGKVGLKEMDDPLGAFEAYDRAEAKGIDWYLRHFWNISPSHPSYRGGGESVGAYYHQGYYYKYYHNFPMFSKSTIRNLYDLGKNYYAVKYDVSSDVDWNDFSGPYYAILKKKNVEGKEMWSAIYNQDTEKAISLDQAIGQAFPEENLAKPTSSKLLVDGNFVEFEAYNIRDNNYFKLRDIAYILNKTASSFEVAWDEKTNTINLLPGKDYTPSGGELKLAKTMKLKDSHPSTSKINLNEKKLDLKAYNIEDNNYFKLRDLGKLLGFKVDWDSESRTIIINSGN